MSEATTTESAAATATASPNAQRHPSLASSPASAERHLRALAQKIKAQQVTRQDSTVVQMMMEYALLRSEHETLCASIVRSADMIDHAPPEATAGDDTSGQTG